MSSAAAMSSSMGGLGSSMSGAQVRGGSQPRGAARPQPACARRQSPKAVGAGALSNAKRLCDAPNKPALPHIQPCVLAVLLHERPPGWQLHVRSDELCQQRRLWRLLGARPGRRAVVLHPAGCHLQALPSTAACASETCTGRWQCDHSCLWSPPPPCPTAPPQPHLASPSPPPGPRPLLHTVRCHELCQQHGRPQLEHGRRAVVLLWWRRQLDVVGDVLCIWRLWRLWRVWRRALDVWRLGPAPLGRRRRLGAPPIRRARRVRVRRRMRRRSRRCKKRALLRGTPLPVRTAAAQRGSARRWEPHNIVLKNTKKQRRAHAPWAISPPRRLTQATYMQAHAAALPPARLYMHAAASGSCLTAAAARRPKHICALPGRDPRARLEWAACLLPCCLAL